MKAKDLYLKKELSEFDISIARTFLINLIGAKRAKSMNLFSLTYFEFKGNSVALNDNENNFKYLDLGENVYIQGKYFSKIAFMAGDGDIILSLIDDDFNNVAGVNITQSLGISKTDEYKFDREKNTSKKENKINYSNSSLSNKSNNNIFSDNNGNFAQEELKEIWEESHKNDNIEPKKTIKQKNNQKKITKNVTTGSMIYFYIKIIAFIFILGILSSIFPESVIYFYIKIIAFTFFILVIIYRIFL